MAKPRKSAGKKKKRDATDIDGATGEMLIPPPRDLKHHVTMIQLAKVKVDKANAELRNAYKIADTAGVNTNSIRKAMALHKKDALTAKAEMVQMDMVLDVLGSPVRFNVHDTKYEDAVAEAKVKGFADGKAAKGQNHPWVKGSPAARQYEESYAEGQLENMPIDSKTKAALRKTADASA